MLYLGFVGIRFESRSESSIHTLSQSVTHLVSSHVYAGVHDLDVGHCSVHVERGVVAQKLVQELVARGNDRLQSNGDGEAQIR